MSFLSRLFGSKSAPKPTRDFEAELQRLEAEAERAAPGYVGTSYNKAGDLALKAGQKDRAMGYYGRAIDAFLEDGQREAARGVANKIIRVRPSAVRTLCTLTWLDLAARHQATALLHLRDYVGAARDSGQHQRAATQIFEMARVSPEHEFVDAVADALDGLDFPNRAEEVRGWAKVGSPGAISETSELDDACLVAAIRSNERDQVLLVDSDDEDGSGGDVSTSGGAGETLSGAGDAPSDDRGEVADDGDLQEVESASGGESDAETSQGERPSATDETESLDGGEVAESDDASASSAGDKGGETTLAVAEDDTSAGSDAAGSDLEASDASEAESTSEEVDTPESAPSDVDASASDARDVEPADDESGDAPESESEESAKPKAESAKTTSAGGGNKKKKGKKGKKKKKKRK